MTVELISVIFLSSKSTAERKNPEAESRWYSTHPIKTTNTRIAIDPKSSSNEDPEIVQARPQRHPGTHAASMDKVIGTTKVDVDARFSETRTKETNISSLVANSMRRATGAQVAILNAGSLRADRITPKGALAASQ